MIFLLFVDIGPRTQKWNLSFQNKTLCALFICKERKSCCFLAVNLANATSCFGLVGLWGNVFCVHNNNNVYVVLLYLLAYCSLFMSNKKVSFLLCAMGNRISKEQKEVIFLCLRKKTFFSGRLNSEICNKSSVSGANFAWFYFSLIAPISLVFMSVLTAWVDNLT